MEKDELYIKIRDMLTSTPIFDKLGPTQKAICIEALRFEVYNKDPNSDKKVISISIPGTIGKKINLSFEGS